MKLNTNNLFKKVARPIVHQTKEVIAEELVSPKPEEVKKEDTEVRIVEGDLTRAEKVMLGVLAIGLAAVFFLTRRPSVKVYVVK